MLILALETSTELGSCALWRDGVVTERFCPEKQPHSETLLPLVRELLAESGVQIADLDAIAFGVGPGAFTGLRVACGAAQGLAGGGRVHRHGHGDSQLLCWAAKAGAKNESM